MAHYWMTFRIHDDATYSDRYEGVIDTINEIGEAFWDGPTSFIAIETEADIGAIAGAVKRHLGPHDLFVIREIARDSVRYIGEPPVISCSLNTCSLKLAQLMLEPRRSSKDRGFRQPMTCVPPKNFLRLARSVE